VRGAGTRFNYSTAFEWALKLKELTYTVAEPYSTADFQHGPIAMVEGGFPVLAVAPSGKVFDTMLEMLGRLRGDQSAELVAISDDKRPLSLAQSPIRCPAGYLNGSALSLLSSLHNSLCFTWPVPRASTPKSRASSARSLKRIRRGFFLINSIHHKTEMEEGKMVAFSSSNIGILQKGITRCGSTVLLLIFAPPLELE